MTKILLIVLACCLPQISHAFEIDSTCRNSWQEREKTMCRDGAFVQGAKEFEPRFWHAAKAIQTHEEWQALQRLRVEFNRQVLVRCSPIAFGLPRRADEYVTCLNSALFDFKRMFSAQYPASVSAEITDAKAELDAAKAQQARLTGLLAERAGVCQIQAADKLDDNVSPASDIALAVATTCRRDALLVSQFIVSSTTGDLYPFVWFSNLPAVPGLAEQMTDQHYGVAASITVVLKRRSVRAAEAKDRATEELRQQAELIRRMEEDKKQKRSAKKKLEM